MRSTLAALLESAAAKHGERIAVEDPARDGVTTYAELQQAANQITRTLVRHGVAPGDRVGVYASKSIESVAAIFGVLGARAAYVPVDPAAPPARSAAILADCSVRAIAVDTSLLAGFQSAWTGEAPRVLEDLGNGLLLVATSAASPNTDLTEPATATADDMAYILYTSGSSGRPKGVVHTHSSALSFIDWCSETFRPLPGDRFSSHAPFHFDLSIFDIYVSLGHGATLVLIGDEAGKQPITLARLIAEKKISVWYSTPSILRLLTGYGRLGSLDYPALRLVLFAGEVFPAKHLRALKDQWPVPEYFNLYGPTETNVCTWYRIPKRIADERTEPFPIGFACSGDRTAVAGENGEPVPPGEEGELLVTGGSVMRGYWNLPERTARAFHVDGSGTAWYRTGDIVRESPEDGYVFLGRRDRMVKRRGYRVELGEIEAVLYQHPLVSEAAMVSLPDEENGVLLKAFLALSQGVRPSVVEMKQFCSARLPAYMIPDRFAFPESLPKTSTDKVDYQRLQELA